MLSLTWKEDMTSPSAGLPQDQVHDSPVTPVAQLEDILKDKSQDTLSNFYKGSPPKWNDYFTAEEQNTLLVRRNGYNEVIKQIRKCHITNRTVSSINLFHHPGSGGSTLAMQILWDLRKDFKCAVIKQSNNEPAVIAEHIIKLFEDQDLDDKRTLLLLDDNCSEGNLIESLNMQIVERRISATVPVAIILNAKRKHTITAGGSLNLKNRLSSKELQDFELKEAEMKLKHSDEEMKQFHGFNLMKNNFSKVYVANLRSVREIMEYAKSHETACSTELFSVLALLNSYVPGSFLTISQCLDLLTPQHSQSSASQQQDNMRNMATLQDPFSIVARESTGTGALEITKRIKFEKVMEPFMDLIVIFPRDEIKSECVRLAHPMIANECLNALAEAGITKGEIAKRFLESCKSNEPPYMVNIIKSLLIKRETVEEEQEMFSRLILDIKDEGDLRMCKELFEIATRTFEQDAFFPQAFARFLYIVLQDFDEAENQARLAIARDPENSFLRDTLGQIHKNHLRTLTRGRVPALKILQVADLAMKAFKEEEKAAENEQDPNSMTASPKKISQAFNCRGLLGYIQVAEILFEALTSLKTSWKDVLTGKKSVRVLPEAKNIRQYEDLIESLQNKVRRKHSFFETYLTYSKPSRFKSDRPSVQRDVDVCYSKYLLQHTKPDARTSHSLLDRSFAGIFSCLERFHCSSFLEKLTEHTRTLYKKKQSDVDAAMKYILSNIILSNKDGTRSRVLQTLDDLRVILWRFVQKQNIHQSPEFFLLVLLLFWSDETHDQPVHYKLDLINVVGNMKTAFDQKYVKRFRSRYLRPLFFLGQGTGMKRLVHSWKIYNVHTKYRQVPMQKKETWATLDWGNGRLWQDSSIQNLLLRVNGVFKRQQLFAYAGDKEISIYTDQSFVSYEGPASFFLGFNINRPVAYDIKFDREKDHEPKCRESQECTDQCRTDSACHSCVDLKDLTNWKQLHPEVLSGEESKNEGQECYRVSSPAGSYECSVSGLRWVCDGAVSLKYNFADWEPYRNNLKSMEFEPCGPLMDITVTSGVLTEVHLPHFACLGDVAESSPSLNDEVRVMDVQNGEMILEKCELTRFHAKLLHPTFSPKGLLIKSGFPLKVHYEVLIYKTSIAHLTLHVYLVTRNPKTIQDVDRQEKDAVKISKPGSGKRLQMQSWYTIQTKKGSDPFSSTINPKSLKLRPSPINYCEIYVKNAEDDFELHLINDKKDKVWAAEIRADEYMKTSSSPAGKY